MTVDASLLNAQLYTHDSATNSMQSYPAGQPMVPGIGYWLHSNIECELLIPQP